MPFWGREDRDDERNDLRYKHKRYEIRRVRDARKRSRSALHARRTNGEKRQEGETPTRRGPKPKGSDGNLLEATKADLEPSPFRGEGHPNVQAGLRYVDGIRVGRKWPQRIMRENGSFSLHRGRSSEAKAHDGKIATLVPSVRRAGDGVRVFRVDDGWVWISAAVEPWNAECVGWNRVRSIAGSRHRSRSHRVCCESTAVSELTSFGSWRSGWITAVSSCRIIFSSGSDSGASAPASVLWSNRKPTEPQSGAIARSKSKRSTEESPRTSRRCVPPWPSSWSNTTRSGVSRRSATRHRPRRANCDSYVRRRRLNPCPRNLY